MFAFWLSVKHCAQYLSYFFWHISVIEHIKFSDIEECQNAVSFLSNYQCPVAVWCFGNQLGEPDGTIDTIVCVTQKKAYFFELTGSLDLIEEGELGSYFNARETSTKVGLLFLLLSVLCSVFSFGSCDLKKCSVVIIQLYTLVLRYQNECFKSN